MGFKSARVLYLTKGCSRHFWRNAIADVWGQMIIGLPIQKLILKEKTVKGCTIVYVPPIKQLSGSFFMGVECVEFGGAHGIGHNYWCCYLLVMIICNDSLQWHERPTCCATR
jgi:hypothetical protein